MTNAEKVVTGILAKVKIKKGGPRTIWIPKTVLRDLLIVAYKSGVVYGVKSLGKALAGKKRGKKGKRCPT